MEKAYVAMNKYLRGFVLHMHVCVLTDISISLPESDSSSDVTVDTGNIF